MTAVEHPTVAQPLPQAAPLSRSAVAGLAAAFVFWPAGLVLSLIAMASTTPRRGPAAKSGRGLAIGGLVCNIAFGVAFVVVVASLVALSHVSTPASQAAGDQEPAAVASPEAPAPLTAEATPEVDNAGLVQQEIDATGGWAHWSDTVVGLRDDGVFLTVDTNLYNKPSNEEDATRLCAFTLSTAYGVTDELAVRVAASDGVALAKCELPS